MKRTLSKQKDAGMLNLTHQEFENFSLEGCVLSMTGASSRSRFQHCLFKDIDIDRCTIGHVIFEKCRFENINSSEALTLYEALLVECEFAGQMKNLNFGNIKVASPFFSNDRFLQDLSVIDHSAFSIDISRVTEMDECAFIGDHLAKRVRFKRNQGLILKGNHLDAILGPTLRSTDDFGLAIVLTTAVGFGATYGIHFAAIPTRLQNNAVEYAAKIRALGVEVIEEPLC